MHAGQFIDRIGVSLGCNFRQGRHLKNLPEQLPGLLNCLFPLKAAKQAFQGLQLRQKRKLAAGEDPAGIALGVQKVLAETFYRLIYNACSEYNTKAVLIAGGVASNTYIREYLHNKLTGRKYHFGTLRHALAAIASGCAAFAVLKGEKSV